MRLLAAIFAIVLLTACQPAVHPPQGGGQIPTKQGEIAVLRLDAPTPIELPGLSNLVAFQAIEAGRSGVISGAAPEGDRGFDSLEQLGIRTIISVDGAPPDAKAAAARGMRTVHIPIQYNGLTDLQRTTLVRAVRDLPKPIYLHCHHGKHRSAAACAIVAVSLGWLTTDEAAARMRVAGTSDAYRGLWACVADASAMTSSAIDAASAEFPATAEPDTLVAMMIELDDLFDRIKLVDANGGQVPATHPDIVPAADIARLADLLNPKRAGVEWPASHGLTPNDFEEIGAHAAELERMSDANTPDAFSSRIQAISACCHACHAKHRN
jgi:protein tyrosine phosphatase (PTP) superfamily phosphohydrolase (DUF442 family)